MQTNKPVALCILDGWGIAPANDSNAVTLARTPVYDQLLDQCPHARLMTHGTSVGLPEGAIGNSEVGHLHIGAGRVVQMDRLRIDNAIAAGELVQQPILNSLADAAVIEDRAVHVIGIISESGVHGLCDHVLSVCRYLESRGIITNIHAITDGRDSSPGQAFKHLSELESQLSKCASIVTVSGRYYAMDRDHRWSRVKLAWDAIVNANGRQVSSALDSVSLAEAAGETDEFYLPSVLCNYGGIKHGEHVVFTNFRSDRMRELSAAIVDPEFCEFEIMGRPRLGQVISMVSYFDPPKPWIKHLFNRPALPNGLGTWLSRHRLSQFRLAETEKYPHVTYFFNGGREDINPLEQRYMAASPKVATYDMAPEMSAAEIADQFHLAVHHGHDFILVNFANPDMVGHTGNLDAAIKACEATDRALKVAVRAIADQGGSMLVTADHGNCEIMIDPDTGQPHTAHTTNPVPLILFGDHKKRGLCSGSLSDLAPTILELIDIDVPNEMTGKSLLA